MASHQQEAVIVGAGPVGLWTAVQIIKRNLAAAVTVYERHVEYQRDHMMSLRKSSLTSFFKRTDDADERAFMAALESAHDTASKNRFSFSKAGGVLYIRTLDFERVLKDYAQKLGVKIVHEDISSPADVMQRHPQCEIFIAADGAHSKMRRHFLSEDGVSSNDLLHSIDVKYEVKGKARYLHEATYRQLEHIMIETVGREKDGKTDVALRFIISKAEYESLPQATFKQPLSLDDVPYPLKGSITKGLWIRKAWAKEERIEGTEKVTKIMLSRYAAKKFTVSAVRPGSGGAKASWFFVGDAAMGVPFYKSVNIGLRMGAQLAALVCAPVPPGLKTAFWQAARPWRVARAFGAVSAKLAGVNAYRKVVRPALIAATPLLAFPVIAIAVPAIWVYSKINPKARLM